ncbi:YtxH domain-containing protein [Loigolactobacillus bifermentans]|uniref:YtxH domain-containing protein n=1 Tax=Loigolactobacillus bifermentans DSM 20003 TaxID=1423726 RepID=A0A0R1H6S1_9LACO|nr:YtxH domain-containing protein [Loigolactobacillus bifermentans]KRK40275.1 hypothetical protein FC07_GL001137 [Loigolactobacillus bifermentans DSM 20003]QGG61746.1 YtxH domain-containing protein [Loigolactobacillus bifermentans]
MAKGHFLLGLLVGGAAAAVATRLLAPESGDEIRQNVNEKLDHLRDRMSDYADFEDDDLAAFDDVDGSVPSDLNADTATDDAVQVEDATTAETGTDDYPDINVDGQSAFAEAKDEAETTPTDTTEATDDASETEATPETEADPAATTTDDQKDDQPEA